MYICVSICKAKRALIHVWEGKSPCQRCSKVLARYKLYRITRLAAEVSLNCHCLVLKKAFFPPLMQTKLFCSQMKQLYIVSALSGAIRVARIEVCSQLRGSVFADVNWSKSRQSARCVAWPSSPYTAACLSPAAVGGCQRPDQKDNKFIELMSNCPISDALSWAWLHLSWWTAI